MSQPNTSPRNQKPYHNLWLYTTPLPRKPWEKDYTQEMDTFRPQPAHLRNQPPRPTTWRQILKELLIILPLQLLAGWIILGIMLGVAIYTLGCELLLPFTPFRCFLLGSLGVPLWYLCEWRKRVLVERKLEEDRRRVLEWERGRRRRRR
ncbi:hypothetical protein B0T20DRAFT_399095 [Sordaria brevicollis]|uniref:Uncharacterized protein n=1 Tax=Sordaria brevicollis TaxID=83679 RepID=A0AAE0PMU3_SORBR|nr:hypothetical protein B0T20DRAFT_399095 [Sordaria brevicollis]